MKIGIPKEIKNNENRVGMTVNDHYNVTSMFQAVTR